MFKWGLIILGLIFLWGGIDNHINYSDRINETSEVVKLETLEKYVGGVVKVAAPITGSTIEMETSRVDEDNVKTASSTMIAAPLMGTNAKLWVLSRPFRAGEDDAKKEWLAQSSFTGGCRILGR